MKLHVIDDIIALAPVVEQLATRIGRHSPELSRQLRRAWPRVLCGASEALHRMGRKNTNRLDDAMGEAREAHSCLRYALACNYVAADTADTIDRIDKVTATLYKLAHKRR